MKKGTWRKHHKWLGLGMTFFLLMFCVSGILLNHRQLIKEVNVSRKFLPSRYEFKNWNGGLLRGTLDIGNTSHLFLTKLLTRVTPFCYMATVASGSQTLRPHSSKISTKDCPQVQTYAKSGM